MQNERTGWAAAVACQSQYKMRNGRTAQLSHYSISNHGAFGINEVITGETRAAPAEIVQWDANGNCLTVTPGKTEIRTILDAKPDPQYDLVEAIRAGAK